MRGVERMARFNAALVRYRAPSELVDYVHDHLGLRPPSADFDLGCFSAAPWACLAMQQRAKDWEQERGPTDRAITAWGGARTRALPRASGAPGSGFQLNLEGL